MNLRPHFMTILKAANRLSVISNQKWRFISLNFIINKRIGDEARAVNKEILAKKLNHILGDFSEFTSVHIDESLKINILRWSDETLEHNFNYLGSGLVKVDPIDWHTDFKSGFTWKKGEFYKKYVEVDLNNNSDVKVPRELSRFHHLLWLGQSYLITQNESYAKEIVFQIEDWINDNPLMYSINWCCAMDVAIRAINWIYALNMIIHSTHVNTGFVKRMYRSLFEHLFFIFYNLEKRIPYSNNHYASNISALLFLSQLFINTKEGKKCWDYSIKEFYSEIRLQVLPSGVHYEKSISYHRLMTEIFTYPYIMLLRIGEYVPIDIKHRIESMFTFVNDYTKPNGLSPLIADNDDGRFLPFYKYDFRDHRYLLAIASELFGFNYNLNKNVYPDSFFLFGPSIKVNDNEKTELANKSVSVLYKDAGFAVMRVNNNYLFIVNSGLCKYSIPSNETIGTHNHADLLSFELSVLGTDIMIDPGTYVYTSDKNARNEFRSTMKHNTVMIDGKDQFSTSKKEMFLASDFCHPNGLILQEKDDKYICIGSYTKQYKDEPILEHQRTFSLYKTDNTFIILDNITNRGNHTLSMYFHFAPDLKVYLNEQELIISRDEIKATMVLYCQSKLILLLIDDEISPSYGIKHNSITLKATIEFNNKVDIKTIIKWMEQRQV